VPSLSPFKLNVIVKYLERSGTILVDGDGYITWMRGNVPEMSSLSDVADLSSEVRELLEKGEQ
jgi:hypothetical protein